MWCHWSVRELLGFVGEGFQVLRSRLPNRGQRTTKTMMALETKCYEPWLKELGMLRVEKTQD